MWSSLLNIAQRAFSLCLDYMGVPIGVLLLCLITLAAQIYTLLEKDPNDLKTQLLGNIGLGVVVTAVFWVALFGFCLTQAVYDDHEYLVKANSEKTTTISEQKAEIEHLRAELQTRGELLLSVSGYAAYMPLGAKTNVIEVTILVRNLTDKIMRAKLSAVLKNELAQTLQERKFDIDVPPGAPVPAAELSGEMDQKTWQQFMSGSGVDRYVEVTLTYDAGSHTARQIHRGKVFYPLPSVDFFEKSTTPLADGK
jgi:hypothetical protein